MGTNQKERKTQREENGEGKEEIWRTGLGELTCD